MAGQIERELQQSKPIVSPEVEAALNIQRTGAFLAKWTNEVLAPVDLRGDEYNVLRILRGAGAKGHPLTEIRNRMIWDTGRLPALMHGLRSRELVDGALRITVTPAGLELLASVDGIIEQAIRDHMRAIDAPTLRTVIEVMEALRADL